MRLSQVIAVLVFSGFPAAAQNCPAINFRNASQVTLDGSGLERLADGSFTLRSYTGTGTVASVQQLAPTPDYQQVVLNCTGRAPHPVVPPANWSFGGDLLLGTIPRNPTAVAFAGAGTGLGLCLQPCPRMQNTLQTVVATPEGNIASAPTYPVSENAYSLVTADLNNDGLQDVVVLNSDTPPTISVYLTQSNGSLGTPTVIPVSAGGLVSATVADFNGDNNLDLALVDGIDTITILLGNGNGTFRTPITVNTGEYPSYIAAADLNGDSILDLAVSTDGGISVHFGNGNGTFQAAQTISTPAYPYAIAAADVNNDGKPDLVVSDAQNGVMMILLNAGDGSFPTVSSYVDASFEDVQFFVMDFDWDGNPDIVSGAGHPDALMQAIYTNSLTVLFGNGDGTFYGIPAYSIGQAAQPGGLAVADFNGDGQLDAVAGSTTGISVLIGNGDGTFTTQNVTKQQGSGSVAAGQFTGSGHTDFVATGASFTFSSSISLYAGNGNGTFQAPVSIPTPATLAASAAVGDFNGDGKLDFAVVDSQGGTSSMAYVYLGNGNGTFQNPKTFVVGSAPQNLQVADVNGDNKPDLVVTNTGTFGSTTDMGNVAVLLGNGDGTFQPAVTYSAGVNPVFTLVTDINGDGKPDLVTSTELNANTFTYGLSVRLNQGGGAFGAAQPFTSNFGPTEIGAGDFNNDGKVDLLVGHCCGNTEMGYFLGNGNGTFQPEVLFISGQGQENVRVANTTGGSTPNALFTMEGVYVASLMNIGSLTTPITIQTVPSGLQFTVDGTAYTAPQTLNLSQVSHTIAVASPQAGPAGTEYTFANWSDGGAASHSITVGASAATYTATFTTQYLLTTAVSPAGAGAVAANPSGTYFNSGTNVQLSASANAGYQFSNWSGDLSGSANPQSIAMNAPQSVTANFTAVISACTLALSPTSASLPPTGTSTVETCPNNSGQPNCGVGPEVPQSFTVTPSATCGPWTATSSNPGFLQILSGAGSGSGSVRFAQLTNTHNGQQSNTITVASGSSSATFTVTEAGSGDNQTYREVYALYEQLLGRDPDAGGFAFWTGVGGAGLGQMADDFLTSPEAFNSDFAVMAAYQAATGTPPTYSQYATAVAAIRAGVQTVPGLFSSLIGSGYTGTTLYQNLLNRAPGTADSSCINTGLSACFQIIIGYPSNTTPVGAANNEFQSTGSYHTTLAADHTNALYVQMVYYVTLDRDPDPSGFSFWLGVANTGGPGILFQGSAGYPTRIQILGPGTPNQGFIGSTEFQGLFAN